MAKKKKRIETRYAERIFSSGDITFGITKLKKRLAELEEIDPDSIHHDSAEIETLTRNIQRNIREVFGERSQEYDELQYLKIEYVEVNLDSRFRMQIHVSDQKAFTDGIPYTIKIIEGLIKVLEEKSEEVGIDAETAAKATFKGLNLHQRILDSCEDLYNDGHYAEAVFNASKTLVNFVKEKSRKHDLDGSSLMTTVFSKKNPVLAFNELSNQSEADEQEGMMHLFQGAVLGIRNPRGHENLYDTPERAQEYIGLLSLLARRLGESKLRK